VSARSHDAPNGEPAGTARPRSTTDATEVATLRRELARRSAELSDARRQLVADATARSDFIARMSHQFRTPLSAVLGFGQLLEMEELGPIAAGYVQQITRGGQALVELVEAVRGFSDLDAGLVIPVMEPVECAPAVVEAVDLVQHLSSARGIDIAVDAIAADARVLADRALLRRILVHLLTNAVTFNRDHGAVGIGCAVSDETVRFVVTDTGAGLSDTELGLLFVPFERLRATERGIDGAGFGLASSKLSAALMHGRLTAWSVEGEGSRFTLELPWPDAPDATMPVGAQP
jgi:signal transduction histidine kinase